MEKNVNVPWRTKMNGITGASKGFPKDGVLVLGSDTETIRGKLYTFQVASDRVAELVYSGPRTGFKKLMGNIFPRVKENVRTLVFFHNLRFDVTALFSDHWESMYDQYNEIRLDKDGYVIQMLYGRVNHVRIWEDLGGYVCKNCGLVPTSQIRRGEERDKEIFTHKRCGGGRARRNLGKGIEFVDSAAFCPPGSKSLAAALKIYGVPYKKLAAPQGLGRRALKGPKFEGYALNDARAERALGSSIIELHKKYDVPPCVSLPHLASRIFRKHFMKPSESYPFPPDKARFAAEYSYHAGKNGCYVKRGVYENVYEYDINSAFPKAMAELPQMIRGKYKKVPSHEKDLVGVYEVSGRFNTGAPKYPIVYDSLFRVCWPEFRREWITGYEVDCLKKDSRYDFKIHKGYVWVPDPKYTHSPLAEFVHHFYRMKQEAPKGPERDTYKNILNSLYGKFAACVEKRVKIITNEWGEISVAEELNPAFQAGSLYHPFIATQITGYVRKMLYHWEMASQALHSATDSVKTFKELPTSNELGGLKKEVYGRCWIFRNKVYLHFAKDNSLCGHDLKKGWLPAKKSTIEQFRLKEVGEERRTGVVWDREDLLHRGKLFTPDGQHLCKYATHAFKGSAYLLYESRDRLIEQGTLGYEYDHMVSLREGLKRGERINDMVRRFETMTLEKTLAA